MLFLFSFLLTNFVSCCIMLVSDSLLFLCSWGCCLIMSHDELKAYILNATLLGNVITSTDSISINFSREAVCRYLKRELIGCIYIDGCYIKLDDKGCIKLVYYDGDEGGMDFGDTIDIIGGFSFYLNETVREVSGSKVRTIGPFGFMGSTIEAVDFPNLYSLCPASFANTDLTEVSFPELSSISRGAFYQCHKLRRVNAPKCLLIKDLAFSGCDSLDEVIYSKDAILENDVYTQRGPVLLL